MLSVLLDLIMVPFVSALRQVDVVLYGFLHQ